MLHINFRPKVDGHAASSVDFAIGPTMPEDVRDRRFSADRFPDSESASPHPGSGKGRTKGLSPPSLLPATMHFFSGNPSVETTEGIIHLYKDRSVWTVNKHFSKTCYYMLQTLGS